MIKKLLLCAVLLVPAAAYADSCKGIYGLAESIMKARQRLVPITEAMEVAERSDQQAVVDMAKMMVKDAYSKPGYSSDEARQREATEFANGYYLLCIKARK